MTFEQLKQSIPDFAKDIRLNLSSVLTPEGAPGLADKQIWAVALACAYQTRSQDLIAAITDGAANTLGDAEREAAKSAASIMAMNNVYYRFTHMIDDKDIAKLPARLRMNVIGNPGVEKLDFELYSLAVSAMNGCSMCVNSHIAQVKKVGASNEAIQSSVRIASVINAAATAIDIK